MIVSTQQTIAPPLFKTMYIGRFAPTPSGPLHFGSLVTALASYCQAKKQRGLWLLRMEDVDTPRVVAGSADDILFTLENYGFEWDGEVLYQSQRFPAYEEILQALIEKDIVYACECSRKYLQRHNLHYGPLGRIYPGFCRHKNLRPNNRSLRLNVETSTVMEFTDKHYGHYSLDLKQQVGDVVLKRVDGIYAYHLAVILDDAFQKVTEIVRGADLLEVSCIHLYLNRLAKLKDACYLHIPLIKNEFGKKLSKQTGAKAIDIKMTSENLIDALRFLGQKTEKPLRSAKPDEILNYAVGVWDSSRIPKPGL